jgi:hypothetical protein
MDTKKLIKAIQLIIKEEVRKEVAKKEKVLRKSLMNEIKQSEVVERDPLDIEHVFEQKTEQPAKSFTNNSMLNEMLNETAQGGEWRSINSTGVGSGMFNSSQAQSFGGRVGQGPQVLQTAEGRAVSTEQLQQTEAGQAVVNALTKDYSGLMKHINAKKGA